MSRHRWVSLVAVSILAIAGLAAAADDDPAAPQEQAAGDDQTAIETTVAQATDQDEAAATAGDAEADGEGEGSDDEGDEEEDDGDESASVRERTKLRIIPDEVLDDASDSDEYVDLGPQITVINGNANRFRRYTFAEPSTPLILYSARAIGTLGDDDLMYDLYTETPLWQNAGAGFMFRDFDGAASLSGDWQRFRFFQDFGNTATPSTRQDAESLLRLRLGSRGWADVTYQRRTFASPAFTTRPIGFVSDEIGAETNWRIGGTTIGASFAWSNYTDNTGPIAIGNRPLTANRTGMTFGLHAGSVGDADVQWDASANYVMATYPQLVGGRFSAVTAGAGVRYRASEDFAIKTGVSHRQILQTVTQNTFNPVSTRVRVSGTFTGINKLRTYFGCERRFGTRYSTQPAFPAPQAFTENQTQDRLWLKGRYRSNSDMIVEFQFKHRVLRGNVTNYIGNGPITVPILLYPNSTTFDLTTSYPTGAGLIKGGVRLGTHSNAARGTTVRSWGLTGLWSRVWSSQWTTMAQVEHTQYDTTRSAMPNFDTELTSFVAATTWGFRKGSVSAAYGLFDSTGSFRARQQDLQLGLEYTPRRHTRLSLTYDRLGESLTGPLPYDAHVLMLRYRREF